jgi:hypothetical protein
VTAVPTTFNRGAWGLLVTMSALWIGFGAGVLVAGRFFVPPGSGLAGPPIALGYGVLGAFALGALAAALAWKARPGVVKAAALTALALGCLETVAIVVGVLVRSS